MEYFPQNLPMHCRLPGTVLPFSPPVYPNPEIGKQPMPIPMPRMPGLIPGSIPGMMSGQISGSMPMPMAPMPPGPAHKLPVIVMPFYSPDTSGKNPQISHQVRPRKRKHPIRKRRPKYYTSDEDSTDTDSSTDTDDSTDTSSERGLWRDPRIGRRSNRHHKSKRKKHQGNNEVLTPILQYVTKDGYVIFEKQISKGEAKDWLVSKGDNKNAIETLSPMKEDDIENSVGETGNNNGHTKVLIKAVEEIEVKTELNPHKLYKTKNVKRKQLRKKGKQ
ncbi:uncharacterized protein LOC112050693 [Bicyclus anynana]|uniref:Uncharacterized protein LOC112050693 n=1 Tax=Bicyclus anynana TaxID=110368 RepID=A0A6J1NIH5_BICAN|nr:uncharacterized protein LOC112050693 [Bicyclus anynana]